MKNFIKKIVQKTLRLFAKIILWRYKPDIVGVTGSVGKTSTKEAIYSVLGHKFNVRRNIKNYNNEIGLPLTIIGAESGHSSLWNWIGVFVKALVLCLWKDSNYPKILILEMAVDRPGDMDYLVAVAPCRIGVVSNISPVHLEFFGSIENIAKEKAKIVSHIEKNGWAVLNCDNELVCNMKKSSQARIMSFGINNEADITASEISVSQTGSSEKRAVAGLSFKMTYQGSTVPIMLPNILGEHLVYATLAAVAVGLIYEINMVDISQALRTFKAPAGRMSLIEGIKRTLIVDDTYNAGPESVKAAIDSLNRLKTDGKKFAVLGDMLELGSFTEKAHKEIGDYVFNNGIDVLITVGVRMKDAARQAIDAGMDENCVFSFSDQKRAGLFVQERVDQDDIILVKGSQGMRMEKIVKEIMAEPMKADKLLVRQEKEWL